ncbi:MAG: ATP-binding protein [Candidatus Woesearchaeota archaeon]
MKKYVLTGGPGVGKTTVLKLLSSNGHVIVEAATAVIREELKKKGKAVPWIDFPLFQKKVLELQLKLEAAVPKGAKMVFLDRGIPDGMAYFLARGQKPPKDLMEKAAKAMYCKVFMLEPLPEFEETEVRRDVELASRIHAEVGKVYRKLGYRLIRVPAMAAEERAGLILGEICRNS